MSAIFKLAISNAYTDRQLVTEIMTLIRTKSKIHVIFQFYQTALGTWPMPYQNTLVRKKHQSCSEPEKQIHPKL